MMMQQYKCFDFCPDVANNNFASLHVPHACLAQFSLSNVHKGGLKHTAFISFPDVAENIDLWKAMYDATSPQEHRYPSPFDGLMGLPKMVILRTLRPDKMVPSVQDYIVENMGQQFIEPPTFDLAGSFDDSTCCAPLIFVLSPGADPMNALMKFGEDKGYSGDRIQTISLGQGQVGTVDYYKPYPSDRGRWVLLIISSMEVGS